MGAGNHAACNHWVQSAVAGPTDVVVLTHLGPPGPVCVSGHGCPSLLSLLCQLLHLQQGKGQGWVQVHIGIQIQTFCVFVIELEFTNVHVFAFDIWF